MVEKTAKEPLSSGAGRARKRSGGQTQDYQRLKNSPHRRLLSTKRRVQQKSPTGFAPLFLPLRLHHLKEFGAVHFGGDQRADLFFIQPATLTVGQGQSPKHLLLHGDGGEHLVNALS